MKGKKERKSGRLILALAVLMPVLTILLSLGTAQLILSGVIPEEGTAAAVLAIGAIITFVLCLISGLQSPRKKFLWSLVTAAGCAGSLLLGNLLFFGVGFGKIWPMLLTVLSAGIFAGLLAGIKRRKYA